MFGQLVPCQGGDVIPLRSRRVVIGHTPPAGSGTEPPRYVQHFELILTEHGWTVHDIATPGGLRVNGIACHKQQLQSGDTLTLGRHRVRIEFESVKPAGSAAPAPQGIQKRLKKHVAGAHPQEAASPKPSPARLIPSAGGRAIPLIKPRLTIGRDDSCDIPLKFVTVSNRHCDLELVDGYWRILDLGSRNGIRVDGIIYQRKWLFPGNVIAIVMHRFRIEYTPQGKPPVDEESIIGQPALWKKAGLSEADLEQFLSRADATAKPDCESRRTTLD